MITHFQLIHSEDMECDSYFIVISRQQPADMHSAWHTKISSILSPWSKEK